MKQTEQQPFGWDRLENLDAVARRYLVKWVRAVDLQAERVLNRSRNFGDREVDAWQFCTAARQFLRALDMVGELPDASPQVREVTQQFLRAHPHLKTARDITDHFDDYAKGLGDIAHPKGHPGDRTATEAAARRFEPRFVVDELSTYIEIDGDRIDIQAVSEATQTLLADVLTELGFALRDKAGELPLDFSDPRAYVMYLSYVARNEVTEQQYRDFVDHLVEDPAIWPRLEQVQSDLGRHLPASGTCDLEYGLVDNWLFPDTHEGRQVTGKDQAILDGWAAVLVPQPDDSWRIRSYTRSP